MLLRFAFLPWLMATGLTVFEVPDAPFDLRVRKRFDGAISVAVLSWRESSDNELGFEILRSDKNSDSFTVVAAVSANTTRYEDKIGRYASGAFRFKVRAFNSEGRSEDSNTTSILF